MPRPDGMFVPPGHMNPNNPHYTPPVMPPPTEPDLPDYAAFLAQLQELIARLAALVPGTPPGEEPDEEPDPVDPPDEEPDPVDPPDEDLITTPVNLWGENFGINGAEQPEIPANHILAPDRISDAWLRNASDRVDLRGDDQDLIFNGFGSTTTVGTDAGEAIITVSDGGEPISDHNPQEGSRYSQQPVKTSALLDADGNVVGELGAGPADDFLTGGGGPDDFHVDIHLNGRANVIAKHTNPETGDVDWAGVTGENGAEHNHWLEGFGTDVITDYNPNEDNIIIEGHTATIKRIVHTDADGSGSTDTVIEVMSQQGDGGGSHDEDFLGTLVVLDNQLNEGDIQVDAESVIGIFETWDL